MGGNLNKKINKRNGRFNKLFSNGFSILTTLTQYKKAYCFCLHTKLNFILESVIISYSIQTKNSAKKEQYITFLVFTFFSVGSFLATVQNSPANIVPQFQSRPNQSRTIQSRRHFSLGDNLVQDNLVQTIQSEPMQSRQFSLANLVQKNLVQVYFQDSLVWKPIQSRGLFSPRQFSPFQYSLGTNIV